MYYIGRVEHGIALRSFSFRRHLLVCLFVGSFFVFVFFCSLCAYQTERAGCSALFYETVSNFV